jgi:hypothetical protein
MHVLISQVNPIAMGVVLVLVNLAIFALALWEQVDTAKKSAALYVETEELKQQLSNFSDAIHNIVTAQWSISVEERRKFQSGGCGSGCS